jgi:glycosyltransferase involved in cell wall biosynthesis
MSPEALPVRVSVVIPTYNCASYLAEALQSVLAQDFRDLEIVVVDDGSTDATPAVAARFESSPRVRYLARPHGGVSRARNEGLRSSTGEYVAFLDADDTWPRADKLSTQVAFLDARREIGWVFADVQDFVEGGRCLTPYLRSVGFYTAGGDAIAPLRLRVATLCGPRFYIPTGTVLIRRACLESVGGFDETLQMYEDLDLWVRLLRRYPIAFQPSVQLARRIHGANHGVQRVRCVEDLRRVIEKLDLEQEGLVFAREARRCHYLSGRADHGNGELGAACRAFRDSLRHGVSLRAALHLLWSGAALGVQWLRVRRAGRP